MSKSRLDISAAAISIFLQDVGKFYDQVRGLVAFGPTLGQTQEVLSHFSNQCCYCNQSIEVRTVFWDYLIPVDKSALGLHAWGNVVPCCRACYENRQQKTWREFVNMRCAPATLASRTVVIESFVSRMRYDLSLDLRIYADTLYEDVGAIAATLIQIRYKQAEQKLRAILAGKPIQRSSIERRANNMNITGND